MAALLVAAVVACGSPGPAEGTVEGLITEVSEESVTVVPGDDGEPQTFVNDAGSQVPLSHLEEHRDQKLPVIVRWERRDGERVAVRIDDA